MTFASVIVHDITRRRPNESCESASKIFCSWRSRRCRFDTKLLLIMTNAVLSQRFHVLHETTLKAEAGEVYKDIEESVVFLIFPHAIA